MNLGLCQVLVAFFYSLVPVSSTSGLCLYPQWRCRPLDPRPPTGEVRKQAFFKYHAWMSADVAWPSRQRNWNCSWMVSILQEQMRRAQIYKRRIAACNP